MSETPITVQKLSYPLPVEVIDGVPQCPCCHEPMVERDGGWMCALGAAVLDHVTPVMARLDATLFGP